MRDKIVGINAVKNKESAYGADPKGIVAARTLGTRVEDAMGLLVAQASTHVF